jgi:hypothetical protein
MCFGRTISSSTMNSELRTLSFTLTVTSIPIRSELNGSQLLLYSRSTDCIGNNSIVDDADRTENTSRDILSVHWCADFRLATSYKLLSYCCNALNWRLFTSRCLETLWPSTLQYLLWNGYHGVVINIQVSLNAVNLLISWVTISLSRTREKPCPCLYSAITLTDRAFAVDSGHHKFCVKWRWLPVRPALDKIFTKVCDMLQSIQLKVCCTCCSGHQW